MLNADLIIGVFSAGLAILAYLVTRDLSRLGVVFVDAVLIIMAVLSTLIVIKGFLKPEQLRFFDSTLERNNVLTGIAILFIYLALLPFAGFLLSSFLFYFAFNTYLTDRDRFATRNLLQSAGLSVVVVTLFYYIFHHFLEVPLPIGTWFER